MSAYVLSTPLE
ncbi:microtubule associated protein-like protein, partial [Leishmania donovani]